MRFLANENIPRSAVEALQDAGHEVAWVRMESPGSSDEAILLRAVDEDRILLTFDKDFGEHAARSGLSPTSGVVLFRLTLGSAEDAGQRLATLLLARMDWAGHFSVIEPGRVRMRPVNAK